jgi:hypothetical protein
MARDRSRSVGRFRSRHSGRLLAVEFPSIVSPRGPSMCVCVCVCVCVWCMYVMRVERVEFGIVTSTVAQGERPQSYDSEQQTYSERESSRSLRVGSHRRTRVLETRV